MAIEGERRDDAWPEAFTAKFIRADDRRAHHRSKHLFWDGFTSDGYQVSPENAEGLLRQKFAEELTRKINAAVARHRRGTWPRPLIPATVRRESKLEFSVLDIRYGSIWAFLGVNDLKGFVDLMNDVGPEFFTTLLGTCSVSAFHATFGGQAVTCDVTLSAQVASMLGNTNGPAAKKTWGDVLLLSFSKVFWFVPTVLMIFLFSLGYESLSKGQDRLKVREDTLSKGQADLVTSAGTLVALAYNRAVELDKINTELIKQLRERSEKDDKAGKAPRDCCCHATPCCAVARRTPSALRRPANTSSCP